MDNFHRVSRREPCPICGKPDWCIVSNDGGTVICMRVESDRPRASGDGGWVHILRRTLPRRTFAPRPRPRTAVDMAKIMLGFRGEFAQYNPRVDLFASRLAISAELAIPAPYLDALEVGRSRLYSAWAFPMRDGDGQVVGVRLREYGGAQKWCVPGSRNGLFYAPNLEIAETPACGVKGREIVIVEGPTDCAAGYALGLATVGRASCSTGADYLRRLCDRLRISRVTIIADNDRYKERATGAPWRPGIAGAEKLARDLGRMFRLVTPPKKDLRDWYKSGLTADTFRRVADTQKWRMPTR